MNKPRNLAILSGGSAGSCPETGLGGFRSEQRDPLGGHIVCDDSSVLPNLRWPFWCHVACEVWARVSASRQSRAADTRQGETRRHWPPSLTGKTSQKIAQRSGRRAGPHGRILKIFFSRPKETQSASASTASDITYLRKPGP